MEWIRSGRAWVYGNNIGGDDIIGGPEAVNKDIRDLSVLASYLMKDFDEVFQKEAKPGDFIVAGKNFGYTKAHWQFYLALNGFGVAGVIAESFPPLIIRGFVGYRIPFLKYERSRREISTYDNLTVNFKSGVIENHTTGKTLEGKGVPEIVFPVYEHDDFLGYLKSKL